LYQFSIPLKTTACMLFLLFQQAPISLLSPVITQMLAGSG
jgi:hypothetical protein